MVSMRAESGAPQSLQQKDQMNMIGVALVNNQPRLSLKGLIEHAELTILLLKRPYYTPIDRAHVERICTLREAMDLLEFLQGRRGSGGHGKSEQEKVDEFYHDTTDHKITWDPLALGGNVNIAIHEVWQFSNPKSRGNNPRRKHQVSASYETYAAAVNTANRNMKNLSKTSTTGAALPVASNHTQHA
jgi:hypothetical protein